MTMVIRLVWYVFETSSFIQVKYIFDSIMQFTHMYAQIGIILIINGLILDRVSFDIFNFKNQ